jgi:rubrerythrin
MKVYICEICGDAYLGEGKPTECPFCGAHANFMKDGREAHPVFLREGNLSEETKKRMEETYELETKAVAIYNCMAGKAQDYEIKVMYKSLARVEMEHAVIVNKFLKKDRPSDREESCSENETENFQKTIELEEHAVKLYVGFAQESAEEKAKIFFTALAGAERSHIKLIKSLTQE